MRVQRCEQAIAILPTTRRVGRLVAKSPQSGRKPVLFVDIDGVIWLWVSDSNARPSGALHDVDGVIHFLSSAAANNLLTLRDRFELVWCSAIPDEPPFLSFERNRGRGDVEELEWWAEAVATGSSERA